ncbi:MAG: DUF559 domain-containing protein [Xanthomonadaceae bacterium]|nr:DUF559 domain-containing protein [Xanthomonadaceae bacterium]
MGQERRGNLQPIDSTVRQVVIGRYIVDFLCVEAMLIVEADGGQHLEQQAYDSERTRCLERMGYKVMRFWDHEILTEMDGVLEQIVQGLTDGPSPRPSPGGRGGTRTR